VGNRWEWGALLKSSTSAPEGGFNSVQRKCYKWGIKIKRTGKPNAGPCEEGTAWLRKAIKGGGGGPLKKSRIPKLRPGIKISPKGDCYEMLKEQKRRGEERYSD